MLNCLCKTLIRRNPLEPTRLDLCLTQKKLLLSYKSEPVSTEPNGSLTARYLVSALGLTPELALSVSRSVPSVDPGKVSGVVAVFDQSGFSRTQISRIVVRFPRVLLFKPGTTIRPKIEFLRARGASEADIEKIICACPRFLFRSLDKHIVPTFDFISRCLKSDYQAVLFATRVGSFYFSRKVSALVRNCDALRAAGVPDENIRFLLRNHHTCLWTSSMKFDHTLERIKSMGCDPSKVKFVVMLHVITALAKSTWEKKVSMFGRWGWSEEDTLLAFVKFPHCMMVSEKKLTAMMEYFINKMGLKPNYLVSHPVIISMSLENRIIPRCTVFEALVSKELIRPLSLSTFLHLPNTSFVDKYISPYLKELPFLQKMYLEKLGKHSIG